MESTRPLWENANSTYNNFPYTVSLAWNPADECAYLRSADHRTFPPLTQGARLMRYCAGTDAWEALDDGVTIAPAPNHGYDNLTVDVAHQRLLYLEHQNVHVLGVWEWPIASKGPWRLVTRPTDYTYWQTVIGTEYVQEKQELLIWDCPTFAVFEGQMLRVDMRALAWTDRKGMTPGVGTSYNCFLVQTPTHLVYTQGMTPAADGSILPDSARTLWAVDKQLVAPVRRLPLAPAGIDIRIQGANMAVGPRTGNLFVMGFWQFWEFRWDKDAWLPHPAPPALLGNPGNPNLTSVASTPFVLKNGQAGIFYASCFGWKCYHHVYKEPGAGGGGVPSAPVKVKVRPTKEGKS